MLPRLTRAVPSALVCILVLTAVTVGFGIDVRTLGDMGELPSTLPVFLLPDLPLTLETLRIIQPYSAGIAVVGLLESLMTAAIVGDMTDTGSDRNGECVGQGIANMVSGVLGGMAGCAMIGQSVIDVKSGGRGGLSTYCAGLFLLFLNVVPGDWVKRIPMAALVAVMIMVSIGTFNWRPLTVNYRRRPFTGGCPSMGTILVRVRPRSRKSIDF